VTTEELSREIQNAPLRLIAGRIKQARKASQTPTLDQLAEQVGTSRHHLIRLEGAKHRPRVEMLQRIAEATEKPLDFFLLEAAGDPNPFPADAA
jgi:transcriptional regulator with XRE-family HTH domain